VSAGHEINSESAYRRLGRVPEATIQPEVELSSSAMSAHRRPSSRLLQGRALTEFRRALIAWGQANYRPFPWRSTRDPYSILIAELMLHRTQASQVLPVYVSFMSRFPDPLALVAATRREIRRELGPLGLQWRIELFCEMATELKVRHSGTVPLDKPSLLSLPGVGEYVASAVQCFSLDLPVPLIDTNTVRVCSRVLGLERKDSSRRSCLYRDTLSALLDPEEPRSFNLAMLDLAAELCTAARAPACGECPLLEFCSLGETHIMKGRCESV
jgi:A/G-specific adenine glycosylase